MTVRELIKKENLKDSINLIVVDKDLEMVAEAKVGTLQVAENIMGSEVLGVAKYTENLFSVQISK
jgi:hypothetical protein